MTEERKGTFDRPGPDVVLRIQDDTVPGGPESTLMVGVVEHVAQYWNECHEASSLWTVQRWDHRLRRWRSLDARERRRFDQTLENLE